MKNRNLFRVLSLALALVMLFAVVACTEDGTADATTDGTTVATTTKATTTAAKTTAKATTAATTQTPPPPADPMIYSGVPDASWYDATKTEFTLTTADQFMGFLDLRAGDTSFEGMTVKLDTDVVINVGTTEEIMATGGPNVCPVFNSGYQFKGTFDGQNHMITGTYQKATGSCVRGLFGAMGDNAVVKNVTIKNHVFGGPTADKNTYGVITPRISGQNVLFSNIKVEDALLQKDSHVLTVIGGLAGRLDVEKDGKTTSLTIENCSTSGIINFVDGGTIGGLVGQVNAGATLTVINSSSSMSITATDLVGGLVGQVTGKFYYTSDCTSTATITVPESAAKGDIFGSIAAGAFVANPSKHFSLDAESKVVEADHTFGTAGDSVSTCTECGYKKTNKSNYQGAVTELKENTPYYILSGVTYKAGAGLTPEGVYSEHYVTGAVNSNKLVANQDKANAKAFMVEKVAEKENYYYIYFTEGDVKTYLAWGTGNGGKGTSQVYTTATKGEACEWYINVADMLIYADNADVVRYLGSFETGDFRMYHCSNFGTYSDEYNKDYYTAWFVPAA